GAMAPRIVAPARPSVEPSRNERTELGPCSCTRCVETDAQADPWIDTEPTRPTRLSMLAPASTNWRGSTWKPLGFTALAIESGGRWTCASAPTASAGNAPAAVGSLEAFSTHVGRVRASELGRTSR